MKFPKETAKDKALDYIEDTLQDSDFNRIRENIYKEIGASSRQKTQYNCWLLANYVCENIKYTGENPGSYYFPSQ